MTPYEVAQTAQKIETEMLGQQCGIQDQLCSAFGGINYIEMYLYPHASVSLLHIPNATWWELERRLALVFLGKSHSSSDVHETVIADLEGAAPDNVKLEESASDGDEVARCGLCRRLGGLGTVYD